MQAHIARIEPMIDRHYYPGHGIGVYFAGCDFNCPACNAADITSFKDEFVLHLRDDVKKIIRESRSSTSYVLFSGGEPLLQRLALLNLAAFAKELGLLVVLETNGSKPEALRSLLDMGLVDLVALDIKAPYEKELFEKATRSRTFFITTEQVMLDVDRSISLLQRYEDRISIEIRTTIIPSLLYKKEDLHRIAEAIESLHARWVLRPFCPEKVLNKNYNQLHAPSREFLENLRESLIRQHPRLRIDIRQED